MPKGIGYGKNAMKGGKSKGKKKSASSKIGGGKKGYKGLNLLEGYPKNKSKKKK